MAVIFSDRQRSVIPQVVDALQQFQDDPDLLAREMHQRYDEPPPPYPGSGETTQPPTPGSSGFDDYYHRLKRWEARYKATPLTQFKMQAKREKDRLFHQVSDARYGRRQTLPWDRSSDLRANSENNVRQRWVEQGIWGEEWGPAFPEESHPMDKRRRGKKMDGPFYGAYHSSADKYSTSSRWGHDDFCEQLESDRAPKPAPGPGFHFRSRAPDPEELPKPHQFAKYIQGPDGPVKLGSSRRPTVRDPEASRPCHQFAYQVRKEREWIKDEMSYKSPGAVLDLDSLAYQSVKDSWQKDGVWNPKWVDLPGTKWLYEELQEEEATEDPTTLVVYYAQERDSADEATEQDGDARNPDVSHGVSSAQNIGGGEASSNDPVVARPPQPEAPRQPSRGIFGIFGTQVEDAPSPGSPKRAAPSDGVEDEQPRQKRPRRSNRGEGPSPAGPSPTGAAKRKGRAAALSKVVEEETPRDAAAPASRRARAEKRDAPGLLRRSHRLAEKEKKQEAETRKKPAVAAKTAKKGWAKRGGGNGAAPKGVKGARGPGTRKIRARGTA